MTIVKVQRPLMTNGDEPTWLVYAKGHQNMQQIPESAVPKDVRAAMGSEFKIYMHAEWDAKSGWSFGKRVTKEPRDW